MKQAIEYKLDQLDRAIHDLMIDAAKSFMDMGLDSMNDIIDSTGGVVQVMQVRHAHAMTAFLGAMMEAGASSDVCRRQADKFRESFSEIVDDAMIQAICQVALNTKGMEGGIQ